MKIAICFGKSKFTGNGFMYPEKFYGYSGYTNSAKSEHDIFEAGHTSTSVSHVSFYSRNL